MRLRNSKIQKNVHTVPDLTVNEIIQKVPKPLTERIILSQVASLYDPLGLATPFTVRCKLLTRSLTLKQKRKRVDETLSWDDPIPDDMCNQWVCLFKDMNALKRVKLKRYIRPDSAVSDPILVLYADASNVAYSTCVYVRFKLQDGTYLA